MLLAIRLVLRLLCLPLVLSPLIAFGSAAEAPSFSTGVSSFNDPVRISLIKEESTIQPGRSFWVAIEMQMEEGWHAYWKNPGDAGMPPVVSWSLPDGFTAEPLIWPTPKRFELASSSGFGYEGNLVLLARITPPESYAESKAVLSADVRWVVCSDSTCMPGDGLVTLTLPLSGEEPAISADSQQLFHQARSRIPKKSNDITAKRNNDLVEIAMKLDEGSKERRQFHRADFFSEKKQAVDSKVPSLLLQPAEDSKAYTVVVRELSTQNSLKGVVVLHSATGTESYEIDVPVIDDLKDSSVSMASPALPKKTIEKNHSSFEFEGGVPLALVLAFIGGMILNLMPCVLPVISFKVFGFIKLAGESRKLIFRHGLAFAAGVLISFWILATLLLVLQAYGRSVGWGFQLQEPLFVAILAAFLFMFGLSLFGLFEFGTSLMSAAGEAQQKGNRRSELLSSFFSGILATAIATPCTGPFLGSAVGFAVTLPSLQAMLIFTSLGLGMAFPYLALAAFPSLLRYMPKPGPWMTTFKELMGFLMMASVVWLVWVFGAQTSSFSLSLLLAGLFLFAFACWIYGRWATPVCARAVRAVGTVAAVLFFGMGCYALIVSTSSWAESMAGSASSKASHSEIADAWEEFSPERVAQLRAKGIPVFIDFTAKWCLICQANHLTLTTDEVSQKFQDQGVVRMKADWTKRDEVIAGELRKFGRNSVPLYVLYDNNPDSDPQILPQVLTSDAILQALDHL